MKDILFNILFSWDGIPHSAAPNVTLAGLAIVECEELAFCANVMKSDDSPTCCAVWTCNFINIALDPVLLPVRKPPIPPIKGAINKKLFPNIFPAVLARVDIIPASDMISDIQTKAAVEMTNGIHCLNVFTNEMNILSLLILKIKIVNRQVTNNQKPGE